MALQDPELTASTWLIRIDASDGVAHHPRFQAWLRAKMRHRAAFRRLQYGWQRADQLRRLRPLDGRVDLEVLDHFRDAAKRD